MLRVTMGTNPNNIDHEQTSSMSTYMRNFHQLNPTSQSVPKQNEQQTQTGRYFKKGRNKKVDLSSPSPLRLLRRTRPFRASRGRLWVGPLSPKWRRRLTWHPEAEAASGKGVFLEAATFEIQQKPGKHKCKTM